MHSDDDMGEVWQATDLATHAELGHSAQVALKILPPRLTENALHEDGLLSRQEFDVRKNAILDAAYAVNAAAEPDAPARPGTEIGLMATQEVGPAHRRYRLERLIAQGGMPFRQASIRWGFSVHP